MTAQTKKIRTYSGIFLGVAALAATASELVTDLLVREAMDRAEPRIMKKGKRRISGNKAKRKANGADSTPDLEREPLNTVRVEITASDGTTLVGHWCPCEAPKRIVLAMHGWRSSWVSDFGAISEFLHDSGCSVLYVEQRAIGESGGRYIGFGMLERYDCLDWLGWINEHGGKTLPIYLCGVSMGATTVMLAAGLELPENVHGVIADCGFTSANDIWRHVCTAHLHLPYVTRAGRISAKCRSRIGFDPADVSTTEALRACNTPVLFIHGSEDHFVPSAMTCRNFAASSGPKRMIFVSGAGHAESYSVDPRKYEAALTDFWQACDVCDTFKEGSICNGNDGSDHAGVYAG